MKRGNLDRWTNLQNCINLLFFSQLVNELLFDYSIPSNRISTLNSHYLCEDALNAIDTIENNGVPQGTLKPIMEELFSELKKDPAFHEDNHPTNYFVKYQSEQYVLCKRVSDIGYSDLKNIALALKQVYFSQNKYFESLKRNIVQIIKDNKIEEQQKLFRLTKSLLTELMNSGYTIKYIELVMSELFWNSKQPIDSTNRIDDFFELFDFKTREFDVVFKLRKKNLGREESLISGFERTDELPDTIKHKASNRFRRKKQDETFIAAKYRARDPFDAQRDVVWTFETNVALYRFYNHSYEYKIQRAECMVFDAERSYTVKKEISAVEHTKMPSNKRVSESMKVISDAMSNIIKGDNYRDCMALLGAIRYHSHSLDSISEENQLLDLWSIFEAVLDISNEHTSDRIQQVCMYLVPLLKQKYIYSLFKQLAEDIRIYNEDLYNNIIGDEKTESEIVRAVCEFTLLEKNKDLREKVLDSCGDFPLLKERISYYSNELASPTKVYSFVEKHAERVRWQIMRIYRNRNLIIHNGSKMSYLSLLIENLHSYVDDFITYIIHSMSKGKDINCMCLDLFTRECKWNSTFLRKKEAIATDEIRYILAI